LRPLGRLASLRRVIAKLRSPCALIRQRHSLLLACLLGSFLACLSNALLAAEEVTLGKPAPEIDGKDIDGKAFKLSDHRGKVVLLTFWGDW